MQAIVLADGDVEARALVDAAWPGWAEPAALVIAADGGARHAEPASASRSTSGSATATRSSPTGSRRSRAAGVEIRLVAAAKDESDTELAVLAARRARCRRDRDRRGARRRRASTTRWPTSRCSPIRRSPVAAGSCSTASSADRAGPRPGRTTARPVRQPLPGRIGDLVTLLPFGDGVEGVTTAGLAYPLRDEPLVAGPARGLSNVRTAADAEVVVRRGMLLVIETPATLPRMSMPAAGDQAPEVALPDETGTIHRLADQRGRWTILYFYPKDDTPGCTVEACEFRDCERDDRRARRRRLGHQPAGRQEQEARSARSSTCRSPSSPTRTHEVAEAYGVVGREAELRQDLLGHRADHVPRRPGGPDRPDAGRRSSRRATPPTCSPTLDDAAGGAGALTAAGMRRTAKETSLVGGDERSLGRKGTAGRAPRKPSTRHAGPHAGRRASRRMSDPTGGGRPTPPRLAPGAVHGHRRPPRRRRVRPVRDGRRAGSTRARPAGSCAAPAATRAARTRTPIRSSSRPCASASSGPPPRSSATTASPSSTSRTARWPTTSPCASMLVREIRTFRPDAVLATDPEALFHADGGHQPHRPSRGRAGRGRRGLSRRRATRWRSRRSRAAASRPTRCAGCTSSGRTSRTPGSTSPPPLDRKIEALRRARQPDPRARRSWARIRDLGRRGGRADRGRRRRSAPGDRHRRRRGRRRGPGLTARSRLRRLRAAGAGHGPTRSRARPSGVGPSAEQRDQLAEGQVARRGAARCSSAATETSA